MALVFCLGIPLSTPVHSIHLVSILPDLRLFERAELMRKYCSIALQHTTSEEYKETLQIALSVANWIDPTTDYVDPILAGHYDVKDFL